MKLSEVIRTIKTIVKNLREFGRIEQLLIYSEIERIQLAHKSISKSLVPFGRKAYSQNEEDGIIDEIFNRIGRKNRIFVEIGIGTGLENNTLALLLEGWSGLWVDADAASVKNIVAAWGRLIASRKLTAIACRVNKSNINQVISNSGISGEIDFLSVDIDGNDVHIFEAIRCISPRCVVIEYNAKYGPKIEYCMPYLEEHVWDGSDAFGASLKYIEVVMARHNYALVGCNITGINAFFVRADLLGDKFIDLCVSETHYQPPRYHLSGYASGHRASFRTIAGIINAPKVN